MNKLILPINAYIVNSNGSIVDAFSGAPSYGNENGADVYHVYNADDNAYYNVLMTEELKAVIATAFNAPYAISYTGGDTRVLTVGSADPKTFEWQPISNLVRKQNTFFNNRTLPIVNNYTAIYAQEPNFLYVTAPSGSAAYISFKRQGSAYGSIYYATDPYASSWSYLSYDTSLNVAGKKYYLRGNINTSGPDSLKYQYIATSGANTISFYGDITFLIGNDYGNANSPYTGGDKPIDNYRFYSFFKDCRQIVKAPDLPSTTLGSNCYYGMFNNCTSLTKAPELPATILASNCYQSMFRNCTSLTTAPELPATALTGYCYYDMFYNCTSLTTAPELPATTLATDCYRDMFYNCTNLTKAPELPATTLTSYCYYGMFSNCTSLTTAPELPAMTLATSCYFSMFSSCTSLTEAPKLPATTLMSTCYYQMFRYCTSLIKAPDLPATTLVSGCYISMFSNCTKLNYVKALFITTPSSSYTASWLYGVASTGTFVKSKNATWTNVGTNAVPVGWTVYKTEQLHTDELPESYIEDTGKVLMVDASGLWVKKKIDIGSQIEYDSSNKVITLKDASGNTLGTPIDATDFIKDGMVNDVSIRDGNMVIGFNTDSGKEDISIPLSRIFDSSNYYMKSESDAKYVWDSSSLWEPGTGTGSAQLKGSGADASGEYSVAEGNSTASDFASHAEGENTTASGFASHAEGESTIASEEGSHAEGMTTTASGTGSHAEGMNTIAFGTGSHAEGGIDIVNFRKLYITGSANGTNYRTTSNHNLNRGDVIKYENIYANVSSIVNSIQFITSRTLDASNSLVNAEVSVCRGIAYGSYSHAEGSRNVASGRNSHAEGANTTASGSNSHAEGEYTVASSSSSHAEGASTTASNMYSHAEGQYTVASGAYSHAEGYKTTASNAYEHAQGILNISHTDTLFSIGKGVDSSGNSIEATNALEIMRNGDAYLYGVALFDGQSIGSAKTLQYYLNTNLISEQEYDYIFNTSSTTLNPQLLHLYIDDYPDENLSGMMREVGAETIDDFYDIVYDANINNGQYDSPAVYANEFIYVDMVTIDSTNYYLWHCINNSDTGDQLYAIMRTDTTLEDLDAMAKCNNPNSNVSPFVAIVAEDLEVRYDDTTSNNVNANYQLACYKIDEE